jgi:hypothetical protein
MWRNEGLHLLQKIDVVTLFKKDSLFVVPLIVNVIELKGLEHWLKMHHRPMFIRSNLSKGIGGLADGVGI